MRLDILKAVQDMRYLGKPWPNGLKVPRTKSPGIDWRIRSGKYMKNPHAVALGKLGGKAGKGASKRRNVTSEQARKAVNARWAKHRTQQQPTN